MWCCSVRLAQTFLFWGETPGMETETVIRNRDQGSSYPLLLPLARRFWGVLLPSPSTWISAMSSWKGSDFSDQTVTSSTALSKFLTYSPYILRNGASFWITSPIRGLQLLQEGTRDHSAMGQTVKSKSKQWLVHGGEQRF